MKPSTSSHHVVALLTLALAAPVGACGSSGPSTGTGAVGNVVIKDANNYSSMSSLTIPVVETKAASDLSISWDGITQDLLCHTAGTIDNVAFLRIGNMTQAQVEDKLARGQLTSTEVTTYREFHTAGATSTMLSTLSFGQPKLDPTTDYVVAPGHPVPAALRARGDVGGRRPVDGLPLAVGDLRQHHRRRAQPLRHRRQLPLLHRQR